MHHRSTIGLKVALSLLGLWLGLWPAVDAMTGASRTAVAMVGGDVIRADELCPDLATHRDACATSRCAVNCPPTPPTPRTCGIASNTAPRPTSSDCSRTGGPCLMPTCDPDDDFPRCPGKTARCLVCFNIGGMVLFACASPDLEPDQTLRGLLRPCCLVGPSRNLQPPVPPPLSFA